MSTLYENAVDADDVDDDSEFEGLDPEEPPSNGNQMNDGWDKDDDPVTWLFAKEGRLRLATEAARQVQEGDPIFHNKSKLSEMADVSRHSAHRYLDDLVALNIYEEHRGDGYDKYRANRDSQIVATMVDLCEQIKSR